MRFDTGVSKQALERPAGSIPRLNGPEGLRPPARSMPRAPPQLTSASSVSCMNSPDEEMSSLWCLINESPNTPGWHPMRSKDVGGALMRNIHRQSQEYVAPARPSGFSPSPPASDPIPIPYKYPAQNEREFWATEEEEASGMMFPMSTGELR